MKIICIDFKVSLVGTLSKIKIKKPSKLRIKLRSHSAAEFLCLSLAVWGKEWAILAVLNNYFLSILSKLSY